VFEKELKQITDSLDLLGERIDSLITQLEGLEEELKRVENRLAELRK